MAALGPGRALRGVGAPGRKGSGAARAPGRKGSGGAGGTQIDKSALARYPKPAVRAVIDDEMRGFHWLPTPDEAWDRALEVRTLLIQKGNRKALSVSDLVIAATAERHGAVVLHYDGDFDMIASATGQRTAWVVPAGSGG
ncbi:PIN domain-containing protein [Streptomyces capillispiralis]|uniref:PIN domain-containing protein n=1 Tax=Streptomyces capillispiralis TaxID=68182 RepID=UPI00369829CA